MKFTDILGAITEYVKWKQEEMENQLTQKVMEIPKSRIYLVTMLD